MKDFLRRAARAAGGAVLTASSGTTAQKKFGVGRLATGEILTTTSVTNRVVRGGVAFERDSGAMLITDAAPGAGAVSARGITVTNGALHVNSSGSGFSADGRISISDTTGGEEDETAPSLSSAQDGTPTSEGTTGAGVTTDEGNGTLYWAVVSDGGSCTDTQLKAGSGGNIVTGVAGNQAVSGTGAQVIGDITGLDAATAYQIKFLHRDTAGNDSSQASVDLTTEAASGDPSFASVTLLAGNDDAADGTATFDDESTANNTISRAGGAVYDDAQKPTGMATSIVFDGTDDKLSVADDADFGFGTGDFTVEFMARSNGALAADVLIDFRESATTDTAPLILWSGTGVLTFQTGTTARINSSAGAIVADTWYHIAAARSSGTTKLFIDGTQVGSDYTDANDYTASRPCSIAGTFSGVALLTGWMSNIRITKGVARYTGSFTPPTLPMPTE